MNLSQNIYAVDSHTEGEPTRIVMGGVRPVPGATMADKKRYLEQDMDHIRSMLMNEPRGHKDMFGCIITEPVSKGADVGVVFMNGGAYQDMCGHGSIGLVTALLETGYFPMKEPTTEVNLDTPAGLVRCVAAVKNMKVESVTIQNVPSFLYHAGAEISIDGKNIKVDIAFGGNFFAIVEAAALGIEVTKSNIDKLVSAGMQIREALNKNIHAEHPANKEIKGVNLALIYQQPETGRPDYKNIVIFGNGQYDRSPCGTGTSAKLAQLYSAGKISVNEKLISESVIGTKFTARIIREEYVGPYKGIVPEITGKAYITGFSNYVFDRDDPFKYGFNV